MSEPEILPPGRSRETKIRRDAEGRWFNDGVEVTHPKLARAFDCWLERAADGRYCLRNAINWAYVQVEGAPCFVRRVTADDLGLQLHLSNDTVTPLEPATLRQGPDGALYCDVPGDLVARFDRAAMMQLAERLHEDEQGLFLDVGGRRVRPPIVQDPLARWHGSL
ncbi:MAG: DUF1285 domain-containing protein [Sandaracinaceae bacterium]|nr:DUF1285 domain-containing protein [Sandaracinaceae bacterium]